MNKLQTYFIYPHKSPPQWSGYSHARAGKKIIFFCCLILLFSFKYQSDSLIFGTWDCTDKSEEFLSYTLVLNEDSSFMEIIDLDPAYDQDSLIHEGTYHLTDDSIFFDYHHPEIEKFKIVKLNKRELVISQIFGIKDDQLVVYHYKRRK